ncbi:ATP-binding cassette domain-containing protein [Streptomyces sp. NPDC056160]|uniref:ATP-binding cassette domain-containing protein n=1 Tax=Streptomyces sp. NPDC056160 TaxID=3345731 RepID=UPI0035D719BB
MGARDATANGPVATVRGPRERHADVTTGDATGLRNEKGEVFGLLGTEGAGRSTTVESLRGDHSRDPGEVAVLGRAPAAAPRA